METQEKKYPKWIETSIAVGAERPFRVLHMSDTHLTLADERDDERKIRLAEKRNPYFHRHTENLRAASDYAREEGIPILHTGDLIDFVSHANLDCARDFARENDLFLVAGNHEFSLYVGEAVEDAAYREQSLDKVQSCFQNDIRFSVREENGVNFVALDNSYYLVEPWQLEALKRVVDEGKPIVLMLHNPLYCEELYRYELERNKGACAYLMAVPEEKMAGYEASRYRQQKGDETTREAYEYICSQPMIRAILAGHLHKSGEYAVNDRLTQYVTGTNTLRVVTFA